MKKKKFRIYPERKSLYFEIEIFDDKKSMLSAIKKEVLISIPQDSEAYVSCFDIFNIKNNKQRKSMILGKIYFNNKYMGVNTVSHEMIHAANGYFARRGFTELEFTTGKASDLEERFCYCVGAMVGDFFYKIGWR